MKQVNMHEAKSTLSSLVEDAVAGEEIIIAKAGVPVVKLVPIHKDCGPRKPGRYKGQISIAEDFDDTPERVIDDFEGHSD